MTDQNPIDLPVTQEAGTAFAPDATAAGFQSVQNAAGNVGFYKPPQAQITADFPQATNTSAPAGNQVDALGGQINSEQTKVLPIDEAPSIPALKSQGEGYAKLLTDRQTQMDTRRQQETDRINAEFQRLSDQQAGQQKAETGATSTKLARMGGYLGESSAGMQYEVSLENAHRQEVRDLESKRQAALTQSQQAFEDGDFKLAQQMLDTARQSEQDIYARQKDYSDQKRQLAQDKLQQEQFGFQKEQYYTEQNQKARDFAISMGIKKPYYSADGTSITDTYSGKTYKNMDEFVAAGGDKNIKPEDIAKLEMPYSKEDLFGSPEYGYYRIDPKTGEPKEILPANSKLNFQVVSEDQDGNKTYGFVDEKSGTVNQIGGGSGTWTGNLGGVTGYGSFKDDGTPIWAAGADIAMKENTKLTSPINGTVEYVGINDGFGLQVRVKGADGKSVWMSHLNGVNANVGDPVKAGQTIALSGGAPGSAKAGTSTGPHLDLTVYDSNGKPLTAFEAEKYVNENYSANTSVAKPMSKKEQDAQAKKEDEYTTKASDLIGKLDDTGAAKVKWGTAFSQMQTKFPELKDIQIDLLLDGGYIDSAETLGKLLAAGANIGNSKVGDWWGRAAKK